MATICATRAVTSTFMPWRVCWRCADRKQVPQDARARLPTDAGPRARLARDKSFVPQRDAGPAIERLEQIGHDQRLSGCAGALPRVYEFARRVDLEEFTLEHVRLSVRMAGRAPPPADAHVAAPFLGVKDARPHPPVDDFLCGEYAEHALRWGSDFDAGQDAAFGEARARPLSVLLIFPPGYASTGPSSSARTPGSLRSSPRRFAAAAGRMHTRARARCACR